MAIPIDADRRVSDDEPVTLGTARDKRYGADTPAEDLLRFQ